MTKEARIKKLGDTLEKIEDAIAKADFSTVDPAKLLDFKLKYTEALKGEYIGTKPAAELGANINAQDIVTALGDRSLLECQQRTQRRVREAAVADQIADGHERRHPDGMAFRQLAARLGREIGPVLDQLEADHA